MHTDANPLPWPELPDEAVVELHDFLQQFITHFESRYFGQIHRYYHDRLPVNLAQPNPLNSAETTDPPF